MASAAKVTRTVASYLLLFVLIFGLAGTVDHAEFRKQFREKRAISIGFFGQFVLLPFFGFCAVKAFNLTALGKPTAEEMAALASGREDPANATATPPITYADFNVGIEAVILLLTTSSPGGSYSNWWCFIFNADLALSVAMTTVSSIASVFMLPINLAIYLNATNSDSIDIEYGPLSIAVTIVVFGIGFGLLASAHFPHKRHVFHTSANVAGLSLIALGLVSTSGSRDGLFGQPWNFFAGVAAPCVVGVVGSFAMSTAAGLTKPQVLSVGIETVYQNTALALSVALASPAPARAAAVPVFYQAVQVVTLFVYSVVGWKMGWTFAPADVSLWRMIVTNYQPVFQKESALVKEELERTRRTLREAEAEAEALGLKSRGLLSAATVRSSLRLLSPSPTPGHSFKAGKSASARCSDSAAPPSRRSPETARRKASKPHPHQGDRWRRRDGWAAWRRRSGTGRPRNIDARCPCPSARISTRGQVWVSVWARSSRRRWQRSGFGTDPRGTSAGFPQVTWTISSPRSRRASRRSRSSTFASRDEAREGSPTAISSGCCRARRAPSRRGRETRRRRWRPYPRG